MVMNIVINILLIMLKSKTKGDRVKKPRFSSSQT